MVGSRLSLLVLLEVVTLIASSVFTPVNIAHGQDSKVGVCTATPDEIIQSRVAVEYQSEFVSRPTRYVDFVTKNDVLIDVRKPTLGPANPLITKIKGALILPLFSIKTKSFLKSKRVILVGNGLDYYELEREVLKLEKLRFRHIRILRYGIIGLVNSDYLDLHQDKLLQLHLVTADELGASALRRKEDFLFLNASGPSNVFDYLGLNYRSAVQLNKASLTDWVKDQMEILSNEEFRGTLVIIDGSPEHHQSILAAAPEYGIKHVLFVKGGSSSLTRFHQKLVANIASQLKTKSKCRS